MDIVCADGEDTMYENRERERERERERATQFQRGALAGIQVKSN